MRQMKHQPFIIGIPVLLFQIIPSFVEASLWGFAVKVTLRHDMHFNLRHQYPLNDNKAPFPGRRSGTLTRLCAYTNSGRERLALIVFGGESVWFGSL